MSSEGLGTVLLMPAAALVGTGILIAKGLMWCGKKMQERYETACQSHTDLALAAFKEQQSHVEDRKIVLATMIEQFTASTNLRTFSTDEPLQQQDATVDNAIKSILERARDALQSSEEVNRLKLEHERIQVRRTLEAEIVASQGIASTEMLLEARRALNRSSQDMRAAQQALQATLQDAEQQTGSDAQLQTNRHQQARNILELVRAELTLIRGLLMRNYGGVDQRYSQDLEALERRMRQIDASVQQGSNAEQALRDARSVQEDARKLEQKVSSNLLNELEDKHKQVLEAQGQLEGLKKVVQESIAAGIVSATQSQGALREIDLLHDQVARMESSSDQQLLRQYIAQIKPLRDKVFKLIGEGQQKGVAEIITTTLGELGFTSDSQKQAPPRIEKVGASARIEARQDEKTVVFFVDRDGGISYDFSGYQGSTCVHEAQKIFAALRKKGIAIADVAAEREMDAYMARGSLTPDMLLDERFAPHIEVNKLQTRISTLLISVLEEKMHFSHIIQNSSGGSIVIDAIGSDNGIGYHIVLNRKGEEQVIRNGENVTTSGNDQLTKEIAAMKEQFKAIESPQSAPVKQVTQKSQSPRIDDDTRTAQQTG